MARRRKPSRPSRPVKKATPRPGKAVGRARKPSGVPRTRKPSRKGQDILGRPKTAPGARKRVLGPTKPLWTLESGFTQSAVTLWESCHEQFGLKYVDGWTPKKLVVPLEYGSLFHVCLEHQFDFANPLACVQTICQQYKAWRSSTLLDNGERDTLDLLLAVCEVTFPAYCKYWAKDDSAIEWVGREEKFSIDYDLLMEPSLGSNPLNVCKLKLVGMRDGLFRVNNILGLFETKTKSKISDREITSDLKADFQTLFYCFVTWLETGEMPKTIKYNIIRRADGHVPYRNKGQSVKDYAQKVAADLDERPDFYFSRFKVDMFEKDIKDFKKLTLDPLLRRFVRWWNDVKKNPLGSGRFTSPYHSRNLNSLRGKYGEADVREIIVNQNYRPYFIRKDVFPELADSFLVTTPSRGKKAK